jgi:small subunit ribosomal protein S16
VAVKLRLRRMGRKKRPVFAVVAADSRFPRDGRYLEDLGRYEPLQETNLVSLKQDRVMYWLENGAQPSDTVRSLLSDEGVMLTLHMRRKGAEQADIEKAVAEFLAHRAELNAAKKTVTASERRAEALKKEEAKAAADAVEAAKQKAEADAAALAAAEAAQMAAAEDRVKAAEEAREEQGAANEATAEDETVPEEEAAAPEAEAPVEEAKAEEAAADKKKKG